MRCTLTLILITTHVNIVRITNTSVTHVRIVILAIAKNIRDWINTAMKSIILENAGQDKYNY